jgi:hypothetical protein
MTESEWLAGSRVEEMLKHLGPSGSPRKLRYFHVACARRVLPPDPDHEMAEALAVAERFADQAASIRELTRARTALKAQQASRPSAGGNRCMEILRERSPTEGHSPGW